MSQKSIVVDETIVDDLVVISTMDFHGVDNTQTVVMWYGGNYGRALHLTLPKPNPPLKNGEHIRVIRTFRVENVDEPTYEI